MIAYPDRSAEAEFDSIREKYRACAVVFLATLSKCTLPARPWGKGGVVPRKLLENAMLDFLHACLAARVVGRGGSGRIPDPRGARAALVRLVVAFALIAVLVGTLNQASGMGVQVAQAATQLR